MLRHDAGTGRYDDDVRRSHFYAMVVIARSPAVTVAFDGLLRYKDVYVLPSNGEHLFCSAAFPPIAMAVFKSLFVAAALCLSSVVVQADLVGLPTVPFNASKGGKSLDLSRIHSIVVDRRHARAKDDDGWTLIPPTLNEFAETFAQDYNDIVGNHVAVQNGTRACSQSIYLTIGNNSDFKDAAGRWTSEAYKIEVKDTGVTVTGASPLGVWWGTRTILQQASLKKGKIAVGNGVDSPGWGTRGVFVGHSCCL